MDHENLQFFGHFFKLYRQEKGASDSLWGLTQAELGAMVAKALKVCRLEGLGIAPIRPAARRPVVGRHHGQEVS
eukprot:6876555-Pyramimonas_sp.AAC.1